MRVALLGPRRVRQGLGPYFASALQAAGAEVVGFGVSRASSLAPAADELRARLGYEVAGHVGVEALIASSRPDALVVASPHATHEGALRAALAARVHVLCEKPLLQPSAAAADEADAFAQAFASHALHLMVHAQWPETIPSYFELFPGLRAVRPRSFAMRLSPSGIGRDALVDSLSHPLSLLQALAPDPSATISDVRIESFDAGTRHEVTWTYDTAEKALACALRLARCEAPPRPAGWGIEGAHAERLISLPEYSLSFASDDHRAASPRIDVPDPLFLRVRRFVDTVASGAPASYDFATGQRMRMLTELLAAYPS